MSWFQFIENLTVLLSIPSGIILTCIALAIGVCMTGFLLLSTIFTSYINNEYYKDQKSILNTIVTLDKLNITLSQVISISSLLFMHRIILNPLACIDKASGIASIISLTIYASVTLITIMNIIRKFKPYFLDVELFEQFASDCKEKLIPELTPGNFWWNIIVLNIKVFLKGLILFYVRLFIFFALPAISIYMFIADPINTLLCAVAMSPFVFAYLNVASLANNGDTYISKRQLTFLPAITSIMSAGSVYALHHLQYIIISHTALVWIVILGIVQTILLIKDKTESTVTGFLNPALMILMILSLSQIPNRNTLKHNTHQYILMNNIQTITDQEILTDDTQTMVYRRINE